MYDLSKDWSSLPSRVKAQEQRAINDMDNLPSIWVQPPWDVPELLVLTAAVSGRIVQNDAEGAQLEYGEDFDSYAAAAAESIDAGACGIHFDVLGIPKIRESGLSLPEIYSKLYKDINSRTQRDWICDANVLTGENFAENMYAITAGLAETVPMAPTFPVDWMESAAQVATEHGVPCVRDSFRGRGRSGEPLDIVQGHPEETCPVGHPHRLPLRWQLGADWPRISLTRRR